MSLSKSTADTLLLAMGGYEQFERGFHARTHYPDRSAKTALADAVQLLEAGSAEMIAAGASEEMLSEWQARFVRLWVDYQRAGARVMSWFITGPARFPVERNRKRMETEQRRYEAFRAHATGATAMVRRKNRSAEKAALSEAASEVDHAETAFPGGRLVRNVPLDRVQLVFDGRPDPDTIAHLKSRAFRWSPREGAWQRQLTRNGIWAAEFVVAAIAKAQGGDA